MGANSWSSISSPNATYELSLNDQEISTDYRCVVRSVAASPPIVLISSSVTVINAYCAPSVLSNGCRFGDTINNFIVNGESGTLINDVGTDCSANNYNNRTSVWVTLMVDTKYIALVSTQWSGNEYCGIWIDFDDDSVFEQSEQVAAKLLVDTQNAAISLTIPTVVGGAVVGDHRMRVAVLRLIPANPCGLPASYGETHDYSVKILPYDGELNFFK